MTTTTKNALNWFEISVKDITKSAALYGAMLDCTLTRTEFGGKAHAMFPSDPSDPTAVGGTLIEDGKAGGGKGTIVYLRATDGVARCLARAIEAGAKVIVPLTNIAPHGEIAVIADFDGNHVGLHAMSGRDSAMSRDPATP